MDNNTLYIVLFLAVIYFVFIHNMEGAENTDDTQTVFGVRNAFTGLHCYDNSLPIVSVDSNTFTCISKDGSNCLMRDDLKIPRENVYDANGKIITTGILCQNKEDKNYNVNTYLSKDGIRQLAGGPSKPNTRDVFNDLDSNGYYTIECNQPALNDPNHWCNKVYNSVDKMCSSFVKPDGTSDDIIKSMYSECTGTLATFKRTPAKAGTSLTKSTLYKKAAADATPVAGATPDALTITNCKSKDCVRNRPKGMSLADCQTNCGVCGKTKC